MFSLLLASLKEIKTFGDFLAIKAWSFASSEWEWGLKKNTAKLLIWVRLKSVTTLGRNLGCRWRTFSLWNTVNGGSAMRFCNLLTILADALAVMKAVLIERRTKWPHWLKGSFMNWVSTRLRSQVRVSSLLEENVYCSFREPLDSVMCEFSLIINKCMVCRNGC